MSKLNLQPVGLLGFFGLKNGGVYPQELGNIVVPQFDILRLYELQREQTVRNGFGVLGAGITEFGPGGLTTDPSVVHHIESVGVWLDCSGAGQSGTLTMGKTDVAGNFCPRGVTITARTGASPPGPMNSTTEYNWWLRPGEAIAVFASNLAAAPQWSWQVTYTTYTQ